MDTKTIKPVIGKLVFGETISTILISSILIAILIAISTFKQTIIQEAQILKLLPTILTILVAFCLIAIIIFYILRVISFKTITYSLTTSFIKKHKKLFNEEKTTIPLEQVTNIQYTKTWILDKLFSTGNLYIHTSGSSSYDLKLDAIKNPQKLYDNLNYILHYEKSETINERGEFTSNTTSKLQKRLKPVTIIPTLGALIGLPIFLIFTGLPVVIGASIFSFLTSESTILMLLGILGILGFFSLWFGSAIITYFSYKRRYYDFYKHKIEFYDGFFTKRKATVATQRITNIDNSQTLLGRIFNFHTIKIETAGSSGAEITISYIKDGDIIVEELKEVLKEHGRN